MDSISRGDQHCQKLLGCYKSKTDQRIPQAVRRAEEEMTIRMTRRKQQLQQEGTAQNADEKK